MLINLGVSTNDRRAALQVARSLQNQLFFYEVEWGGRDLSDSVEDVFMFLDDDGGAGDEQGGSTSMAVALGLDEMQELPTGVITILTKCYSPSCGEGTEGCYAYGCPKRGLVRFLLKFSCRIPHVMCFSRLERMSSLSLHSNRNPLRPL